jgi:hypothetical protein
VLSASVYIAFCSARNRARVRLKRLREPRYLVGAIAGVAYLYFAVFARGRRPGVRAGRGRGADPSSIFPPAFQMAGTSVVGLAALVFAALAWVLPGKSALLQFSEAERMFLFPAPVSRRQLLAHRLVRTQFGSLIASGFIALFATPVSGLARVRLAFGFWVLLVTIRTYFGAVVLARAGLRSAVPAERRRASIPMAAMVAGVAVVGASVVRQLLQPAAGVSDVVVQIARATSTGLPSVVLWPFVAILRPPFAQSTPAFLAALASSLVVLAAVIAWLLMSDAAFDAVAGEGGGKGEPVVKRTRVMPRAATVGWTLPLTGRPELALLWKGAMETLRAANVKSWRLVPPIVALLIGIFGATFGVMGGQKIQGTSAFLMALGIIVAGFSAILGPQMFRLDLRSDFEHLDLLKTWPLRAADVIRGEMAWPVIVVSLVMWLGVFTAAVFSSTAAPSLPLTGRWSFAIAAAVGGPALIAAQYVVHNAMTVLFPAWVQIGSQRVRGIDAMGQRLIMLAAIVVSLAVFALPGAIAGGAVWFLFHRLVGDLVYVPAAMVFAVVVLVEVLAVTELLGPAYERIDIASVERGE